jgi:hypothetical protein
MPAGGKNIWLEVNVSNGGEVFTLTIVEEAGMAQQVEFTSMELARILHEKGSVADRLSAAGFGDTKPVADNKTEEGRAQNRRVELVKK